jgi:predicted metal-dependent hydrolase
MEEVMSSAPTLRRPDGVRVTYRRMKFDFESGFDRYWHGGSAFRSLFWTQLSTAFEPGERFFIDSARALRGRVEDPALLDEIGEFCKQEGHHTAQHLKFDRMNEAMGIDVAGCRARYAGLLDHVRADLDPIEMLAVTCALEHFTAGFAQSYFDNAKLAAGADPRVAALWGWHAAEESEHRATCFDLWQAVDGPYHRRIGALIGAWVSIVAIALVNTVILLKRDGKLWTRDTLEGIAYLFGRDGLISGLFPAFVAYLRPGFHPWDGADGAEIARWQANNARYITLDDGRTSVAS